MKHYFSFILLFCLLNCCEPFAIYATHAAGGEIQIVCVHDSTYAIIYKHYRDCTGRTAYDTANICYHNSCNATQGTLILHKMSGLLPDGRANGSEFLGKCGTNSCTNPALTYVGYQEWWYTDTLTLPSRCDSWTFSHTEYQRNWQATNLAQFDPLTSAYSNLYSEATLNNVVAQGNNSPDFLIQSIPPYICDNSPSVIDNGAYDPDNDSLYFEMIQPMTGDTTCPDTGIILVHPEPYVASIYSINHPFDMVGNINIDHATGVFKFMPNTLETAQIAMRVSEYRNGVKIGSVTRDMQLTIIPCVANTTLIDSVPVNVSGGISSSYDPTLINMWAGDTLSYKVRAMSQLGNDTVYLSTKINTATASIFTVPNNGRIADTGTFTWTPAIADTGMHVVLFVADDSVCSGTFQYSTAYLTVKIFVKKRPAVTGINMTSNEKIIQLYPNPSNGRFTIQINPGTETDQIHINICSVTGQSILSRVYSNSGKTATIPVELSDVAKGLYFVIIEADGKKETRKLILR